MQFADPYALRRKEPRETIVFAASQRIGQREKQEDYFLNFNDECFALASGDTSLPHGDIAAKLASETAIWGYKHIRQHRYYWLDKKLFMKRIFRSTNLTIWQKQREAGFTDGMATTLLVCMVGANRYWIGYAGNSTAWLIHGNDSTKLIGENPPGVLGKKRLGLVPDYVSGDFRPGDTLVLASQGLANYVLPSDLLSCGAMSGTSTEEIHRALDTLFSSAEQNGSTEHMTAVIIKRIKTE